jgi:4-nitrophenyl phosphatase/phosphoglycolate phosphatase
MSLLLLLLMLPLLASAFLPPPRPSLAPSLITSRLLASVPRLSSPATWLKGIDTFVFDCDGVIWRGDSVIDGVPGILAKLRAAGKKM